MPGPEVGLDDLADPIESLGWKAVEQEAALVGQRLGEQSRDWRKPVGPA